MEEGRRAFKISTRKRKRKILLGRHWTEDIIRLDLKVSRNVLVLRPKVHGFKSG